MAINVISNAAAPTFINPETGEVSNERERRGVYRQVYFSHVDWADEEIKVSVADAPSEHRINMLYKNRFLFDDDLSPLEAEDVAHMLLAAAREVRGE